MTMKYLPNMVIQFNPTARAKYQRGFHAMIIRALTILLLLSSQIACTATMLPPYEATYTTKLRGIKIAATRKFENTGENSYKVSWKAKALWMRLNEWSEFEIVDGDKVRPLSYHYTRKGLGTDRPIHIYFDWDNAVINASKGKKNYQLPLTPGTLDKLSYQVQMQMDLLSKPGSKQLVYQVANHDRLKTYEFVYQGEHTIETKIGTVNSLLYQREVGDRATKIWLSPMQYYLPVRIEQIEDGDSSIAAIKNWKSNSKNRNRNPISLSALESNLSNVNDAKQDRLNNEGSFTDVFLDDETDAEDDF